MTDLIMSIGQWFPINRSLRVYFSWITDSLCTFLFVAIKKGSLDNARGRLVFKYHHCKTLKSLFTSNNSLYCFLFKMLQFWWHLLKYDENLFAMMRLHNFEWEKGSIFLIILLELTWKDHGSCLSWFSCLIKQLYDM